MRMPLFIASTRWIQLIGLVIAVLGAQATEAGSPIVDPQLRAATSRRVLVFVPGITGSSLRDRTTGETVWGLGRNLIKPKDGGHALALPIVGDEAPRIEAFGVIEELRLVGYRKPIYGPIRELLEANGYRTGDPIQPDAEADLYFFPYDWRRDNVGSAQALMAALDGIRQARGVSTLPVDLICQSNGAHICRYVIKYGAASLDAALDGEASPPATLDVGRVILVGTANGGSIRILREIDRGRRYVPLAGRYLNPETLFTFPSLYQDLPAYRDDLFVDENGQALEVDLYDPAQWRHYGWSVYRPDVAERLAAIDRPDLFGNPADRLAFLTRVLARARRFQDALRRDVEGFRAPRYHLIQGRDRKTPERAVLEERKASWSLRFVGDRGVRGIVAARASGPGDGHAPVTSQLWLSRQELAAIADDPVTRTFFVGGKHFEMILGADTHRRLLEILR